MFVTRKRQYRGDDTGLSWPTSTSGSSTAVSDVFGPRPFSAHIATVGYDYDFHRGIDFPVAQGGDLYSPMHGAVARRNYSHFNWQDSTHLNEFSLSSPSGTLSTQISNNTLQLTCARSGASTFPHGIDILQAKTGRLSPKADDWIIEAELTSSISLSGGVFGIGVFNSGRTEFVALDYDGTTFTTRASGSNTFVENGATFSSSGKTWMRVEYSSSIDKFSWSNSTDGSTWTVLTSSTTGRTFTTTTSSFVPGLYWKASDSNVASQTINLTNFNWVNSDTSIGRFGNWITITSPTKKILMMHFQSLYTSLGDIVAPGTYIGKAGKSGFDITSGRIQTVHCHLEYAPNNNYLYDNDEVVNPLDKNLLPRINVSNNVSVIRTSGNDPDGIDSHILTVTVTRADQDFDMNSITLTGNSATRTVNWNTRSGLNSNNDIPKNSGVYIVPSNFDENSASYQIVFYFNKTTVGSTFSSWAIYDTQSTLLASE